MGSQRPVDLLITPYFKWFCFLIIGIVFFLCGISFASTPSIQGTEIHLYDVTYGFTAADGTAACAPSGTEVYVVLDDGSGSVMVSINRVDGYKNSVLKVGCPTPVVVSNLYKIAKLALLGGKYASQSFVSGILAVPFKWHLSDKSVTMGSTLGGYVGYQTTVFNAITFTPIVGGGLALISQNPPGGSGNATYSGVSLATGLIGTIGPGSTGVQWGIITGMDWLGHSAQYPYEGKPWLALEVGFNFGL